MFDKWANDKVAQQKTVALRLRRHRNPRPLRLPRGKGRGTGTWQQLPFTRPSWLAYLRCRVGPRGAYPGHHEFRCPCHRSATIRPHGLNTGHVCFGFRSRVASCNWADSPIFRSFVFEDVGILITRCSLLSFRQRPSVLQNEWALTNWPQCKHTSSYQ